MNSNLFQTFAGRQLRATDARNSEGAPAYAFDPRHALAQYAATGCLHGTFYATAEMQLENLLALCDAVPAEFVAKTAVYARERGHMKDMPAVLVALLTVQDANLAERIFDRVIDDGKMLRNFVNVLRSGVVGRKSLGSLPKRLVQRWFARRTDDQVFRAQVGQAPSLADVIKMAHPRPETASRRALFGWLLGRSYEAGALPEIVKMLEAYKAGRGRRYVPDVPFQLLTALDLGRDDWVEIARHATWQQARMNLNTFARHGVFERKKLPGIIADKLRNRAEIKKARVMPYQLMAACLATGSDVPSLVRDALEEAMEIALENVSQLGRVVVCPDVSGSMQSPVTGYKKGATTRMRCIDVAGLLAAAVLRKNKDAEVIPFEHEVVPLRLSARDSVLTNAAKLASVGGGGTSCSAPLELLNRRRAQADLVIFVSDNESWVDAGGRGTAMMREWQAFKQRNGQAKLVCIDLVPNRTTQAHDDVAILNVGGFSDAVFDVLRVFAKDGLEARHWVGVIEGVQL
jgi:60 kDa SS-A/Ro ribonucleoprotein